MKKSLDLALDMINSLLQQEQKAGRVNGLNDIADSQHRRAAIDHHWQAIQTELASIDTQIRDLPRLPPQEQIIWAQSVLTLRGLAFLELDTTGLDDQDEIVRFTLIDSTFQTIDDFLIKPKSRQLSQGASRVNGITPEQLEREGIAIEEAWERIQAALRGHYVVSYSQEWDIQRLQKTARRHNLEPVMVIGDDLQHHTFLSYHREYNLTLASICERIGHPLPEYPNQTSLDRAQGQVHVLTAMANAVTDVRPGKTKGTSIGSDVDLDTDALGDLDSHPF
ncbi:MAG: hypothetical protein H0V70_01705 [Ktedonobacteraceae bacterium]|nr:hypothetical protein [Ktedonobacteraceae bacterium]